MNSAPVLHSKHYRERRTSPTPAAANLIIWKLNGEPSPKVTMTSQQSLCPSRTAAVPIDVLNLFLQLPYALRHRYKSEADSLQSPCRQS